MARSKAETASRAAARRKAAAELERRKRVNFRGLRGAFGKAFGQFNVFGTVAESVKKVTK